MRSSLISSAAILASFALLTSVSTSRADTGPATQPAGMAYAPRTGSVSVMVLPFRLIGGTTEGAWISEAIAEDMRTELLKNPAISLASRPASLPQSVDEAIQVGRLFGASYVVYGTYQFVDNRLRVTGTVLNETEGSVATELNATGDLHNLFQMEDGLAAQAERVLPAPPAELALAAADQTPQAAEAPQTSFFYSSPSPAPNYEYVEANTVYYPPVQYAYPYAYNGGIVYGGFGFLGNGRFSITRPFGNSGFINRGGFGTFRSGGFIGGGFRSGGFRAGGGFRSGGSFRGGGRR